MRRTLAILVDKWLQDVRRAELSVFGIHSCVSSGTCLLVVLIQPLQLNRLVTADAFILRQYA